MVKEELCNKMENSDGLEKELERLKETIEEF